MLWIIWEIRNPRDAYFKTTQKEVNFVGEQERIPSWSNVGGLAHPMNWGLKQGELEGNVKHWKGWSPKSDVSCERLSAKYNLMFSNFRIHFWGWCVWLGRGIEYLVADRKSLTKENILLVVVGG